MNKKEDAKTADVLEQPQPVAVISSEAKKPTVFQEVYPLQEPYVYAAIVKEPETQKTRYQIIEPTLQPDEEKHLREIKSFLMDELDVSLKEIESKEKAENYLNQTTNVNPADFRNSTGYWKIKVRGVKADVAQFDLTADLIEIKAVKSEGTLFTVRDEGASTLHIVSLWINNLAQHQRYGVDIFINSGETMSLTYSDITLPDKPYTIRVVTERGNIAVFSSG